MNLRALGPAVSVAAILAAQAAHAELTAQDVWDTWKGNMAVAADESLTIGSEDYVSGVLVVNDISIVSDDGFDMIELTIPTMSFTENRDGTVSITVSDEIPLIYTSRPWYGGETVVTMAITNQGLEINVSGSAEDMTQSTTANRIAIELLGVVEDESEDVAASGSVAMNGLQLTSRLIDGDLQSYTMDLAIASVDMLLEATDEWSELDLNFSGKIENIAGSAAMMIPADIDENPDMGFVNGLALEGGYSFGSTAYILNMTEFGADMMATMSVQGGQTEAVFNKDLFAYSASATGLAVDVAGMAVPLPISATLAEYGVAVFAPLSRSDAPAEFGLGITFADLAISDDLWGMLDPAGMFARDPATVILDITGTASLLFDILDPEQAMEMMMSDVPGELNSVSLNDLVLSIGGAQLSAAGAFIFDNDDMFTFGGFPRPEGELTVQVKGANALLDNLVAMGLLPQEEVMGARMMLGLFTQAVGDDELSSTIEINDQGHVIANGQRLQ